MNKKAVVGVAFLAAIGLSACTTAMYGEGFAPVAGAANQYTFKIETGGFSGRDTADERAKAEISSFMQQHNYKSYEIVESHYDLLPSGFEYTVRFKA